MLPLQNEPQGQTPNILGDGMEMHGATSRYKGGHGMAIRTAAHRHIEGHPAEEDLLNCAEGGIGGTVDR